jgi:enoyl-CoA hydratase/carnithine racemase
MNADVLTTTIENAIAVITLGSAKRIYFDEEMGDSLTAALEEAALMHIFLGDPVAPQEAARLGLVNETVSGKALDRALEIARRLASRPPEAVGYIKRLIRNATETPLAQGLALERNLFLRLCTSEPALARMRSHEGMKITAPSRSIEVETGSASHD